MAADYRLRGSQGKESINDLARHMAHTVISHVCRHCNRNSRYRMESKPRSGVTRRMYNERDLARDKRMGFDNDECFTRSLMVALMEAGGQQASIDPLDVAQLADILTAQYKAMCQQCE